MGLTGFEHIEPFSFIYQDYAYACGSLELCMFRLFEELVELPRPLGHARLAAPAAMSAQVHARGKDNTNNTYWFGNAPKSVF